MSPSKPLLKLYLPIIAIIGGDIAFSSLAHASPQSSAQIQPAAETMADAIRKYGSPLYRSEREVKRQSLWHYPSFTLLFQDGIVVGSKSAGESSSPIAGVQPDAKKRPLHQTRNRTQPALTSDILREIMGVYGEQGGAPSAPAIAPFGSAPIHPPMDDVGRGMPIPFQRQPAEITEMGE